MEQSVFGLELHEKSYKPLYSPFLALLRSKSVSRPFAHTQLLPKSIFFNIFCLFGPNANVLVLWSQNQKTFLKNDVA